MNLWRKNEPTVKLDKENMRLFGPRLHTSKIHRVSENHTWPTKWSNLNISTLNL